MVSPQPAGPPLCHLSTSPAMESTPRRSRAGHVRSCAMAGTEAVEGVWASDHFAVAAEARMLSPRIAELVAIAQVVGSVGMFGVIWMMQLVHYPLMHFVPEERFTRFETAHRQRISLVVGPLMALEGLCGRGWRLRCSWLFCGEAFRCRRGKPLVSLQTRVLQRVARSCYVADMATTISQRELRNDSGEIMRRVERGERFTVTRNGVPVADLLPHDQATASRRRFLPVDEVATGLGRLPEWDVAHFAAERRELDAAVDDRDVDRWGGGV